MESAAALAGDRAAPERETTKKVIVIGDGHVGKTCFVSKITQNKFITNYHATVGGLCSAAMERETTKKVIVIGDGQEKIQSPDYA